jgi:hypothetical protein
MQFSTVAIIAAAVASVNAATSTVIQSSEVILTITSCGPEVTSCPGRIHSASSNYTAPANVTSWENGVASNKFAAGAAVLAAGALLAL